MAEEEAKKTVLLAIESAFAEVRLGDGVSLRETLALDNYWPDEKRQTLRESSEKEDWRHVVGDPELTRLAHVGGLAFFDAQGMRFHLPAYLTLAVNRFDDPAADDVLESLMYTLTKPGVESDSRFSLLSPGQRVCVGRVLSHLRRTYELQSPELDDAIPTWLEAR